LINPEWQEIKVKADLTEADRIRNFLRQKLHGLTIVEEEELKLELALYEIFVNIALHAYPEERGGITVRIRVGDGTLYMEIRDRGVPFNPIEAPPIDLDEKLRLGSRGGLGIYLYKTLMDGYSYRRDGDENVLTVYRQIANRD
jgi:anti-sigma regulatory factor (Ser/Thr protein kinase)